MEQRRLRLGDILDDYCPRERRVTNHAVVAMIEESVKQTRCTTCDAEHPYKGGREPRRRKAPETSALYREVLADMPEAPPTPPAPSVSDGNTLAASSEVEAVALPAVVPDAEALPEVVEPREEGPVHRPLIRATLPRPEGQKETRQIPDFTIRHNAGRGGQYPRRPAPPRRGRERQRHQWQPASGPSLRGRALIRGARPRVVGPWWRRRIPWWPRPGPGRPQRHGGKKRSR